jgi:hypothetical protein
MAFSVTLLLYVAEVITSTLSDCASTTFSGITSAASPLPWLCSMSSISTISWLRTVTSTLADTGKEQYEPEYFHQERIKHQCFS